MGSDEVVGLSNLAPKQSVRIARAPGRPSPSYVANDLAGWLEQQGMRHARGKHYHPSETSSPLDGFGFVVANSPSADLGALSLSSPFPNRLFSNQATL